jgi:hypothetical protein
MRTSPFHPEASRRGRCCERTVREHSTPNHALHRFRFRFRYRPRPRFSNHTRLGWLVREVSRRGRRGRGGVFDLATEVGRACALIQIISGNFGKYRFQPTKPIAETTSTPHANLSFPSGGLAQRRCCERTVREHSTPNHALHRFRFRFRFRPRFSNHTRLGWLVREVSRRGRRGRGGVFELAAGVGRACALIQIISGNFGKYRFQPTKPIAEITSTPHANLSFASGGLPQRRCCERTVREHSMLNLTIHRFRFRFRNRFRFRFRFARFRFRFRFRFARFRFRYRPRF